MLFIESQYNGHLKTPWIPETFKYQIFCSSDFKWFGIQMFSYVLCRTRPTIQTPDQYIRKQDGIHLSGIEMVGRSGIQIAF